MTSLQLGILTLYLNNHGILEERKIYEQMIIEGEKLGIQVIVFTPEDVSYQQKKVYAHCYHTSQKTWSRKWLPIPSHIFDRCRVQHSTRMKKLRQFKNSFPEISYLNKPIGHKWSVQKKLEESNELRYYIPHTILYNNMADLIKMLNKYNMVFLKPINGTGGRGILKIERFANNMFHVSGRDLNRKIITPLKLTNLSLRSYIQNWTSSYGGYLIQQGVAVQLSNGRVHDYRLLVQKDGLGNWQVTGCAGRIGASRSVTSNLHGGGTAVSMEKLLRSFVNQDVDLNSIQREVNSLGISIAKHLENSSSILCEIAIDIAIDRYGHIWIIEINPKPAREVFKEIGELEIYKTAIRRPMEYAKYHYLRSIN